MCASDLSDAEIISLLGGVTAVARLLAIKPPSVHAWLTKGIPEVRLIQLAARVERASDGRFCRMQRWPMSYLDIWPELATSPTTQESVNA
jgi:hypothetical protein